jgi:hypothetical protein
MEVTSVKNIQQLQPETKVAAEQAIQKGTENPFLALIESLLQENPTVTKDELLKNVSDKLLQLNPKDAPQEMQLLNDLTDLISAAPTKDDSNLMGMLSKMNQTKQTTKQVKQTDDIAETLKKVQKDHLQKMLSPQDPGKSNLSLTNSAEATAEQIPKAKMSLKDVLLKSSQSTTPMEPNAFFNTQGKMLTSANTKQETQEKVIQSLLHKIETVLPTVKMGESITVDFVHKDLGPMLLTVEKSLVDKNIQIKLVSDTKETRDVLLSSKNDLIATLQSRGHLVSEFSVLPVFKMEQVATLQESLKQATGQKDIAPTFLEMSSDKFSNGPGNSFQESQDKNKRQQLWDILKERRSSYA